MDHLISIVQAQLAGLDNPLTESDLISLGLSLGPALLLDALDLVDRHQGEQTALSVRLGQLANQTADPGSVAPTSDFQQCPPSRRLQDGW